MTLYQSDKYPVYLGKGQKVGLCTVWTDPEIIYRTQPRVVGKVAILGSLYSREGVSILLRNLFLNPAISRLYLWGWSPLSKTEFGRQGSSILKDIWQKKTIPDSIHPEINPDRIKALVKQVELIDISKSTPAKLVKAVEESNKSVSRLSLSFPNHRSAESDTWPSELVGWTFRGRKITDVWVKIVDAIMRYGVAKDTEYGNKQKEIIAATWVISDENTTKPYLPDWPQSLKSLLKVNRRSLREYYPEFMSAKLPAGIAYTYGKRLWGGVNQIGQIIDHLKDSPVTRRAVASTWRIGPDGDRRTKNPPCFITVQFIQTNGRLHTLAIFRSHDIFKAAIPNAFGLRRLQEYVAQKTGFEVGSLTITSNSAHIYEEDWDQAGKLVKCQIRTRRPDPVYNPSISADPRGNLLIHLNKQQIKAELVSPDGGVLSVISGKTARSIALKLAEQNLLSLGSHWLDIGMELIKAETCLKLNKPYCQDHNLSRLLNQ